MTLVENLEAVIDRLCERDKPFARSLITSVRLREYAADRQEYWLNELIRRANADEPKAVKIGDLTGIRKLFDAAAGSGLKSPSIILAVPGLDIEVKLSIAGGSSVAPGAINVATPGGYGRNVWFGRIGIDGVFQPSARSEVPAKLIEFLTAFASDPETVAREQGRLTGRCCLCARPLSDPASVRMGLGPTCAARWGVSRTKASAKTNPQSDLFACEAAA